MTASLTEANIFSETEKNLYDLFVTEYNDLFKDILQLNKKNILSKIIHNILSYLGQRKFNLFPKDMVQKITNKLTYEKINPDFDLIKKLNTNIYPQLPILDINTILAHCDKCYECYHICGEKLRLHKKLNLIVCSKCNQLYKPELIHLFCKECNEEYFSYEVNEEEQKFLQKEDYIPITWEKYHCKNFIYEGIKCPHCQHIIFFNNSKKLFKCFNCNWESKATETKWSCEICGQEFQSKLKEYIKYETKPLLNCIKYAKINKIPVKPYECRCCNKNPLKMNFYHEDEGGCGGKLYLSYLQRIPVIVCSKCKEVKKVKEMRWFCPSCHEKFYCEKIIIIKKIKIRKGKLELFKIDESTNNSHKFKDFFRKNKIVREDDVNKSFDGSSEKNNNEISTTSGLKRINSNFNIKNKDNFTIKSGDIYGNIRDHSLNIKNKNNNTIKDSCSNENTQREFNTIIKPQKATMQDLNNCTYMSFLKKNKNLQKALNISDNKKSNKNQKFLNSLPNILIEDNNSKENSFDKAHELLSSKNYSKKLNFSFNNSVLRNENCHFSNSISKNLHRENILNNPLEELEPDPKISNFLEPGKTFLPSEFHIINKIGHGSFGKIFCVNWIKNNKKYAMKIMRLPRLEEMENIKNKLNILTDFIKQTNCENVIKVYGTLYEKMSLNNYKCYVLMELAQGDWEMELKYRSKYNLYYSEEELYNITKQLIKCYSLMQKNNISHRDIKPQNILVVNNIYKVCDFGEAVVIKKKNGYIHQPIRGSELYMSPVLFNALNNHILDVVHNTYKSDVFSLGMCLFLAATLTFQSLYDIRELKNMGVIGTVLDKYLFPHYSGHFVNILFSMLQVEEKLRPDFIELEASIEEN